MMIMTYYLPFANLVTFFIHVGHLVNVTLLVVGDPFSGLLAVFEMARPQPCAVIAEPFPVTIHLAVDNVSFALNASVFVVVDVLLIHDPTIPSRYPTLDSSSATAREDIVIASLLGIPSIYQTVLFANTTSYTRRHPAARA